MLNLRIVADIKWFASFTAGVLFMFFRLLWFIILLTISGYLLSAPWVNVYKCIIFG